MQSDPSSWVQTLLNKKYGQYFTSILIHGWWQMPCEGGCSNGSRIIGSAEVKPPGYCIVAQMDNLVVKEQHVDRCACTQGSLMSSRITNRWIRLLGLNWLRWICNGNIRVNGF